MSEIPSKGAEIIAEQLYNAGKNAKHAIVEVGTWLGAGAYHLARGAEAGNNAPIYCYDRFIMQENELEWADLDLPAGAVTREVARKNISYDNLTLTATKVMGITWQNGPISVYVDDAGKDKRRFSHKMSQLEPSFIKGETLCFFMDVLFWQKTGSDRHKWQYEYIMVKYTPLEMFGWEAGGLFLYE